MSNTVRRYIIEFEGSDNEGYSAYVPDLPVVLAVSDTFEELKSRISEAVELHLELMAEKGLPIPEPTTSGLFVEVSDVTQAVEETATSSNPKSRYRSRLVSVWFC